MTINKALIPLEELQNQIFLVRGHRVMLDFDLAKLYGVTTFNLNKAVRRNRERFPADFVFPIAPQEVVRLIFQSGISKKERGGRRKPVLAFTEQGVAMLSGVLRRRTRGPGERRHHAGFCSLAENAFGA